MPRPQRHRSYCFTINNYTFEDLSDLLEWLDAKYFIIGFEVGDEGTPHIQGYVQFRNAVTFNRLKSIVPRAHIDAAKGTPDQNITYCSKDGEFYEFGERPTNGGQLTWEQLETAMQSPKDNIHISFMYRKTYESIRQREIADSDVETSYYIINPIHDAITEICTYFDDEDIADICIINDMSELGFYDNPETVILFLDYYDHKYTLYPRGAPILYKYGFEYRSIKPKRFILVNSQPNLFPLYKLIL